MKLTHWVIIATVVALVGFDIAAAVTELPTISEVIWANVGKHPVIPFAAGMLCGHLFWMR